MLCEREGRARAQVRTFGELEERHLRKRGTVSPRDEVDEEGRREEEEEEGRTQVRRPVALQAQLVPSHGTSLYRAVDAHAQGGEGFDDVLGRSGRAVLAVGVREDLAQDVAHAADDLGVREADRDLLPSRGRHECPHERDRDPDGDAHEPLPGDVPPARARSVSSSRLTVEEERERGRRTRSRRSTRTGCARLATCSREESQGRRNSERRRGSRDARVADDEHGRDGRKEGRHDGLHVDAVEEDEGPGDRTDRSDSDRMTFAGLRRDRPQEEPDCCAGDSAEHPDEVAERDVAVEGRQGSTPA